MVLVSFTVIETLTKIGPMEQRAEFLSKKFVYL